MRLAGEMCGLRYQIQWGLVDITRVYSSAAMRNKRR
jgi:hypothetical protein